MRARAALLLALGAGCGPSDGSVILRFPSEAARQATKKVELYAIADGLSAERPRCDALLGKLPREEPLGVDLITEAFPLPREGARTITGFPAGAPVVLVVGLDAADNRLFQGCSDHFGLELGNRDVEIQLSAILPAGVFLERVMKRLDGPGGGELFWCHVTGRSLDPSEPHAAGIWAFEDLSARRKLRVEFTPREREIAALLIEGLTSKLIGKRLGVSPRTVDVYRARLMRKVGASTTAELVKKLLAG